MKEQKRFSKIPKIIDNIGCVLKKNTYDYHFHFYQCSIFRDFAQDYIYKSLCAESSSKQINIHFKYNLLCCHSKK